MVGFTKKKVNSETLNERLKKIRERAGISLDEIAKSTKVRKVYLEKLEEGKFDELPPDVYVKGFLRSYAGYLGIEPKDVITLYNKERGIQKNIEKLKAPKKKNKKVMAPALTITPRVFAIAFTLLLLVVGGWYFYREINRFSAVPRLVLVQPTKNVSIEGNTVEIVGITDKDNKVYINGQPIFVTDRGEFKESISLQYGINDLEVKAINRFDKESIKNVSVSSSYIADNSQEGSEDGEKVMGEQNEQLPEKITLEIKVEESPTWIAVEIDGADIQSGTMLPGSIQIFEANEKIAVTSGKANKTIIKLNGEELGALNSSVGVVRDVVFTKETKIIPEPTVKEIKKEEKKKD